jgi:hypothetical protein
VIPSPRPDFILSFDRTVTRRDSAVIEDRSAGMVWVIEEKRRSTEMLTPGIARISRAILAMTGISC